MAIQTSLADFPETTLARALIRNRVLIALIALHFVVTLAAGEMARVPYNPGMFQALWGLFTYLMPCFLGVIVIWRYAVMVRYHRNERPIAWLIADLRRIAGGRERVVEGVATLVVLTLFTGSYGYFKEIIPDLMPFSWDPLFARLDLALHGGIAPHVVLMRIFGAPWTVSAFNLAYQGWFFVMFFMVFVAAFSNADRGSRATFLIAFVIAWGLGGNVVATLLSSAGPCYYGRLGFGPEYDHLNATLAAFNHVAPIWSLDVQQWLWDGYTGHGDIKGISAMPSMHVASTTVLTLYGFRRGRWVGRALSVFLAMIMIAAVLLAWHYAVDVYAGAAFGLFSWWAAARLIGDRAWRGPLVQQPVK